MRVQLGHTGGKPAQIVQTEHGHVLVLAKGLRTTDELVRRLDELLRPYEARELRTQQMFRYAAAAEALGVSPNYLKERVRRGEIPHHKVGTYVRFTAEDIEEIRDLMRRGGDPA